MAATKNSFACLFDLIAEKKNLSSSDALMLTLFSKTENLFEKFFLGDFNKNNSKRSGTLWIKNLEEIFVSQKMSYALIFHFETEARSSADESENNFCKLFVRCLLLSNRRTKFFMQSISHFRERLFKLNQILSLISWMKILKIIKLNWDSEEVPHSRIGLFLISSRFIYL